MSTHTQDDPFSADSEGRFNLRFESPATLLTHLLRISRRTGIYRGQGDEKWRLTTSLERVLVQRPSDRSPEQVERGIQRRFIDSAFELLSRTPDARDELAWLALMQHYGAPTRLLDWTRSPIVALYFAYEDAAFSGDRALWGIDARNMISQYAGLDDSYRPRRDPFRSHVRRLETPGGERTTWPFDSINWREDENNAVKLMRANVESAPHLVVPSELNPRQAAQQSLFTYDASLQGGLPFERCEAFKILLPSEWRASVLTMLRMMGITAAALFPGLDGVGRAALLSATLPNELEDEMGY